MDRSGIFDMHCHIIPEVDDGAKSEQEAAKILEREYDQGVRKIILTPHYRKGMFETSRRIVREQFELVKYLAERTGEGIEAYLGCEFHVNMDMLQMIRRDTSYTMVESKYVLVEFEKDVQKKYMKERLYSLIAGGYKPVIAHIERYRSCRNDVELIREVADMGARIQVNADSVLGKEGFMTRWFCGCLLKEGLVDFIGSDCHGSIERISRIGETYEFVGRKYGTDYADVIFRENPQKILDNAEARKRL